MDSGAGGEAVSPYFVKDLGWQARLCKKTLDAPCKAHRGVSGSGYAPTYYYIASPLPCYCMHPIVAGLEPSFRRTLCLDGAT